MMLNSILTVICLAQVLGIQKVDFPKDGDIWVFPKIGVKPPKWMVKIMENPIEMDDLGGKPTIYGNTHLREESFYFGNFWINFVF